MKEESERHLRVLVGLDLCGSWRAGDLRVFHFGVLRPWQDGFVGDWAVHVQCAWRLEKEGGPLLTGAADLYEPLSDDVDWNHWDYEVDGNVQDSVMALLTPSFSDARAGTQNLKPLRVDRVECTTTGDAVFTFGHGIRLVIFPDGTKGEMWRLLRPGADDAHFVMTGSGIESIE